MANRLLLLLTVGTMLSTCAHAQTSTWMIDPVHSSVNFEVLHLALDHVHGAFGNVQGAVTINDKDITKSTVTATIDTSTVATGIAARDKDLKSDHFFDVEKTPAMTFKSTALTKVGGKLRLIGDLTIVGVTRSVTLDLDGPTAPRTEAGKTISGFSATGKLSRKSFAFGQKTAAAATVGDEVKFTVNVELDRQ